MEKIREEWTQSDDSDPPPEQFDAKYLIRKIAVDAKDFDLYKRAMVHEVANFADIVLQEQQEPTTEEEE